MSLLKKFRNGNASPPYTVYVDMDDVLCAYSKAYEKALKEKPNMPYPQSQYAFFLHLEPLPDAIEAMTRLIHSPLVELYILSAPSYQNPMCYAEKRAWVEQYFGLDFTQRLILTCNKGLLKGELLIDDQVAGKGQDAFEGELLPFGSDKFPDWKVVMAYLNGAFGI